MSDARSALRRSQAARGVAAAAAAVAAVERDDFCDGSGLHSAVGSDSSDDHEHEHEREQEQEQEQDEDVRTPTAKSPLSAVLSKRPTFITRLHAALTARTFGAALAWSEDGERVLLSVDEELVQRQFASKKEALTMSTSTQYASFMRQLHYYGFRRAAHSDEGYRAYEHPWFRRGASAYQLALMLRKTNGAAAAHREAAAAQTTAALATASLARQTLHALHTAVNNGKGLTTALRNARRVLGIAEPPSLVPRKRGRPRLPSDPSSEDVAPDEDESQVRAPDEEESQMRTPDERTPEAGGCFIAAFASAPEPAPAAATTAGGGTSESLLFAVTALRDRVAALRAAIIEKEGAALDAASIAAVDTLVVAARRAADRAAEVATATQSVGVLVRAIHAMATAHQPPPVSYSSSSRS